MELQGLGQGNETTVGVVSQIKGLTADRLGFSKRGGNE
jgi:hypothetical protein